MALTKHVCPTADFIVGAVALEEEFRRYKADAEARINQLESVLKTIQRICKGNL